MKFSICLILSIFFLIKISIADVTSQGWRRPDKSDITGNWKQLSKGVEPFHLKADFNGDNIIDEAWILVKEKNEASWRLVALMGRKDNSPTEIVLDENIKDSPQKMGVVLTQPGKFKTACGKGYWECKVGESKEIVLKRPAINLFMYESAESLFYWDDEQNKFKRTWLSD